jgi:hypothetical protein
LSFFATNIDSQLFYAENFQQDAPQGAVRDGVRVCKVRRDAGKEKGHKLEEGERGVAMEGEDNIMCLTRWQAHEKEEETDLCRGLHALQGD